MEYVSRSEELPRIVIDNVGYCFADDLQKIGESGDCMVNINCSPEGDDWQTEKKGVCKMLMYLTNGSQGTGWYLCTGSLINNTAQDLTPYVLSANHCISGVADGDLDRWQFLFHYESEGCANAYPENSYTLVGCYFRASTPIVGGADGLLLELSSEVPAKWDVFFNGWDRRNEVVPGLGVGIHHPAGDLKKITTFNNYVAGTWPGADYNPPGANDAHWIYSSIETENGHGVTEGGSSGSPMFSKEKLIVGTLTGGSSACNRLFGQNYYGKLWYHWDKSGGSSEEQMKYWLDPLDLGVETLEGIAFNPASPRVETSKQSFSFSGMEYVGQPQEGEMVEILGYNLTENIHVETALPFELSIDKAGWGTSLALPPAGATIYLRYAPGQPGVYLEEINISGEEFKTRTIELYGESCVESVLVSLPEMAYAGQAYSFNLKATGSEAPYSYEITEGELPQGLLLTSGGTISGIPSEFGTFFFTLSIVDKYGCENEIEAGLYVACEVIDTFLYTMNFETESNYQCLEYDQIYGDLNWEFQDGGGVGKDKKPASAYEGTTNAVLRSVNEYGYSTLLITPMLDFSSFENMPQLSFWHAQVNWYGAQDELRVYYKNSPFAEWTLLAEYTGNIRNWTQETILLPDASAEYFIAFEGKAFYGYGVVLDEITFSESDMVSVEKIDNSNSAIRYNNPVGDELRLVLPENANKVLIYSVAGNLVYSVSLNSLANELIIPTNHWNKGVYVLIVENNKNRITYKLIK